MTELVTACVLFVIAAAVLVLGVRSLMEKGPLLNNAYLYASQKEREAMNKAPYYRQSGVALVLVAAVFALNGIGVLFHLQWMWLVVAAVLAGTAVYAVVSGIRIAKKS